MLYRYWFCGLWGLVVLVGPAFAQQIERQYSDAEIESITLQTCSNGPERRPAHGAAVARTFAQLGWRAINAGDPHGAAEVFVLALNTGPEQAEFYGGLGVAAHIAGWRDDYLDACFGRAKALVPDAAGPWGNHGRALEERGQAAAAIPLFEEALKRDPDYLMAHVGLANAYAKVGDEARAERYARSARELSRKR